MLLFVYSLAVLWWDLARVVVACSFAVIEMMYRTIIPVKEKPVLGQIILVVGTGRGVGREIALQLTSLGAVVICVDINEKMNLATVSAANKYSTTGRAFSCICDVSDREQVLKMASEIKKNIGRVTGIIHCCALPSPQSYIYRTEQEVRRTVDVCVMSYFWLLEAFLQEMVEKNDGHIVALSSVTGLAGVKQHISMSASQYAVQGLMESLSEELRTAKMSNNVYMTLVHIYPFIVSREQAKDIRLRIPSYFGTIYPKDAARQIISGMRRNYPEVSIPGYLLYISRILRILPHKASVMLRELLDTGVDFA
ncbi:short-chain dehydrogenase/reductase family 16C member 6-like [Schistocerca piceifrons]|uniref:short-chain dehydrogenase/reductase family 16C member 6-like n=1 Tax=Schistocerca piceifrons TaxID=274613 RepID=UPI001F5FC9EE|nr:short-chain dehydrogenase/reductase family 16C member 6-like [Schistocerca piceifrons]